MVLNVMAHGQNYLIRACTILQSYNGKKRVEKFTKHNISINFISLTYDVISLTALTKIVSINIYLAIMLLQLLARLCARMADTACWVSRVSRASASQSEDTRPASPRS